MSLLDRMSRALVGKGGSRLRDTDGVCGTVSSCGDWMLRCSPVGVFTGDSGSCRTVGSVAERMPGEHGEHTCGQGSGSWRA